MPNIKIQKMGVEIYLLCQGFSPLLILAFGNRQHASQMQSCSFTLIGRGRAGSIRCT
jgi:hypothetical protein